MNFYRIVFADGLEIEEHGDDEADVRGFLARSYKGRAVSEIVQL